MYIFTDTYSLLPHFIVYFDWFCVLQVHSRSEKNPWVASFNWQQFEASSKKVVKIFVTVRRFPFFSIITVHKKYRHQLHGGC
jgi:hypothetical protein